MTQAARPIIRQAFPIETRMALAETDLDDNDARHDRLADEVASVKRVLVGILTTLATSAVLLALDLVTRAH